MRPQRFWSKANKPENGCWEWSSGCCPKGYGKFRFNGHNRFAHRVAYELTYGPIPAGKIVMHRCDNRRCINPEHLSVGTIAENTADMYRKGRARKGRVYFGEANPFSKLTAEQVADIRVMAGSARIAAERYGVCRGTVDKIRRREIWR